MKHSYILLTSSSWLFFFLGYRALDRKLNLPGQATDTREQRGFMFQTHLAQGDQRRSDRHEIIAFFKCRQAQTFLNIHTGFNESLHTKSTQEYRGENGNPASKRKRGLSAGPSHILLSPLHLGRNRPALRGLFIGEFGRYADVAGYPLTAKRRTQ